MDARRLLQSLNGVGQQAKPYFGILLGVVEAHEQITDHALSSLVNKKGIAGHAPILQSNVSRQNLGVDVAQDHVGGTLIVPGHGLRPKLAFAVQQRAQAAGGVVPQVEDFNAFKDTAHSSLGTSYWPMPRVAWAREHSLPTMRV